MRIADRRPLAAPLPAGVLLLYAAMAIAAAALMVAAAVRYASTQARRRRRSRRHDGRRFGLGGLSSLAQGVAAREAGVSPVQRNVIVTYYGSPRAPSMGILGQHTPEDAADLLAQRAASFRAADAAVSVLPALHLVYAVAQPQSQSDSLYLQYVDDRTVRQYIELARRRGFVLILDLQIGHSNALAEVQKIAPYLRGAGCSSRSTRSSRWRAAQSPARRSAASTRATSTPCRSTSRRWRATSNLPKKMLIVHQFQAEMITDPGAIERRGDVDLVIDMDGYGPADIKQVKYLHYGAAPYAPYGGIKIFLAARSGSADRAPAPGDDAAPVAVRVPVRDR